MKIAFMTTLGRNVGDEFIREGIRSYFDDLSIAYDPYYVDKHDLTSLYQPRLDEIERVHDKIFSADVVVQSGAPVYWCNGPHRSYTAAWHAALWEDRIFEIGSDRPVLNLGAGAGQKNVHDLETMLNDAELGDFAHKAAAACRLTTVRDPLAARYLTSLGIEHELLPCPAFHAARRFSAGRAVDRPREILAVNFMPQAGHYRLKAETDAAAWRNIIERVLPKLRQQHQLLFVAHDAIESEFMVELLRGQEMVFFSTDYRDYLSVYSRVAGIVANRVHAGVAVAGFGRPAVIVGNDARIGIAGPMNIPAIDAADLPGENWIVDQLTAQCEQGEALMTARLRLRDQSAGDYARKIAAAVCLDSPIRSAEAA